MEATEICDKKYFTGSIQAVDVASLRRKDGIFRDPFYLDPDFVWRAHPAAAHRKNHAVRGCYCNHRQTAVSKVPFPSFVLFLWDVCPGVLNRSRFSRPGECYRLEIRTGLDPFWQINFK